MVSDLQREGRMEILERRFMIGSCVGGVGGQPAQQEEAEE